MSSVRRGTDLPPSPSSRNAMQFASQIQLDRMRRAAEERQSYVAREIRVAASRETVTFTLFTAAALVSLASAVASVYLLLTHRIDAGVAACGMAVLTNGGTVLLRRMERQRAADKLVLREQLEREARVAEIAGIAALAERPHQSAIVVELAHILSTMLTAPDPQR